MMLQLSLTSIWCSRRSHQATNYRERLFSCSHCCCPAVSTVVSFWCSSARRDKTPCFGFRVICVFHWPPHSEGSTFWSSRLRPRHTSELNKLPHECKLSIVYKSTVKKRGKRLMLRRFPEFEFARGSTIAANIFRILSGLTLDLCGSAKLTSSSN